MTQKTFFLKFYRRALSRFERYAVFLAGKRLFYPQTSRSF